MRVHKPPAHARKGMHMHSVSAGLCSLQVWCPLPHKGFWGVQTSHTVQQRCMHKHPPCADVQQRCMHKHPPCADVQQHCMHEHLLYMQLQCVAVQLWQVCPPPGRS